MESDGTELKPRLFLQDGCWRCLYKHEGAFSLHSWEGLGRTPTEAYQSMVGMMGDKARLLWIK